jgi:hypothetical protein
LFAFLIEKPNTGRRAQYKLIGPVSPKQSPETSSDEKGNHYNQIIGKLNFCEPVVVDYLRISSGVNVERPYYDGSKYGDNEDGLQNGHNDNVASCYYVNRG